MAKIIHLQGTKEFPDLDTLVGAYFHQDYCINGNTLEEVVNTYQSRALRDHGAIERPRADIERFLAERADDRQLWLTRISELLQR